MDPYIKERTQLSRLSSPCTSSRKSQPPPLSIAAAISLASTASSLPSSPHSRFRLQPAAFVRLSPRYLWRDLLKD